MSNFQKLFRKKSLILYPLKLKQHKPMLFKKTKKKKIIKKLSKTTKLPSLTFENMHHSKALYISKVEMPADVGNSYCDMYLKVLIYLLI